MTTLLDPNFEYTPSSKTDVQATWRKHGWKPHEQKPPEKMLDRLAQMIFAQYMRDQEERQRQKRTALRLANRLH